MRMLITLHGAPELRGLSSERRRHVIAAARRNAPAKLTRSMLGILFQVVPGLIFGFVWSFFGGRGSSAPPDWLLTFIAVGGLTVILAALSFPSVEYRLLRAELAARAANEKENA